MDRVPWRSKMAASMLDDVLEELISLIPADRERGQNLGEDPSEEPEDLGPVLGTSSS
jgi:hypothetical protein